MEDSLEIYKQTKDICGRLINDTFRLLNIEDEYGLLMEDDKRLLFQVLKTIAFIETTAEIKILNEKVKEINFSLYNTNNK